MDLRMLFEGMIKACRSAFPCPQDEKIRGHQSALESTLWQMNRAHPRTIRSILLDLQEGALPEPQNIAGRLERQPTPNICPGPPAQWPRSATPGSPATAPMGASNIFGISGSTRVRNALGWSEITGVPSILKIRNIFGCGHGDIKYCSGQ